MKNWGFIQYAIPMFSFMLDGGCNNADKQLNQLIPDDSEGKHYYTNSGSFKRKI